MSRNMNMPDREWSKNMWARIAALIDGQGQAIAGAIKAVTFNGGNVPPDATGRVTMTETDPTVPAWAKATSKPSYTAQEVGALPSSTAIPSKTSDLTNDGDGDSPFATLDDIPATSAPDVSQATGVLAIEHGGTGAWNENEALYLLGAAGMLHYYNADASTKRELKLKLVADLAADTAPRIVEFESGITSLLTDNKVSGNFEGFIRFKPVPGVGHVFFYAGLIAYTTATGDMIYGSSLFEPAMPDDAVTARVYEVTGTAL